MLLCKQKLQPWLWHHLQLCQVAPLVCLLLGCVWFSSQIEYFDITFFYRDFFSHPLDTLQDFENILNWKGPTGITESNSYLHTASLRNQTIVHITYGRKPPEGLGGIDDTTGVLWQKARVQVMVSGGFMGNTFCLKWLLCYSILFPPHAFHPK